MKIHPLITTTEELADLCERLAKSEFVCVDTEFMRENTYYPLLCLVQLGNEEEAAAIDPLAEGIDLSPMLALLTSLSSVGKSVFGWAAGDIAAHAGWPMLFVSAAVLALPGIALARYIE